MAKYILVNRDVYSKSRNACVPSLPGSKIAQIRPDGTCEGYPNNYPNELGGVKRAKPSRPNILDQNTNNNPNPGKGGPLCCLVVEYKKCCTAYSPQPCDTGCTNKWNMQSCRAKCVYTPYGPQHRIYGDISANTLEFVGKTRSILIDENVIEDI